MDKKDVILHVDHMTKNFGDLKVLNDISFDVHKGEFLCNVPELHHRHIRPVRRTDLSTR